MTTKKDESRFTIRFNQENPRHKEAIRILNRHGKGMASLIAESLCMYVHCGASTYSHLANVEQKTTAPQLQESSNFQNTLNSALDFFS